MIILVICVLVITFRILKNYYKYDLEREAMQALLEGMSEAQDKIVRNYKRLNRKLTEGQVTEARDYAVNHAIQVASGKSQKYLKGMTQERINSCIRQLLTRAKQR